MNGEIRGWLQDVYTDVVHGIVLWIIDEAGQSHQFKQPYNVTFYVAGEFGRLRQLWQFLRQQEYAVTLERTTQHDLFDGQIDTLLITVDAADQVRLFHRIKRAFPSLHYYNADIPISVHYAAQTNVFPTAHCHVEVENNVVQSITPLDSRWDIDSSTPPLRIMTIEPNCDPSHQEPTAIHVSINDKTQVYSLQNGRLLLIGLQAKLRRYNPDLILTKFGDTWLFPHLKQIASDLSLLFNPSRDEERPYLNKKANSYFTYGMVLHRGEQNYLYGRWHIDIKNALLFNEYDVSGVIEQARVTGMPVQEMARRSPGAGITAAQMITALQDNILIPFVKQQVEYYKSARQLIRSDKGGLVFQPTVGLHRDVIEIDFVSMYPSIISLFNVSPETVNITSEEMATVPELGLKIDQTRRGLLPKTLERIIEKRIQIKKKMRGLNSHDRVYKVLKSRSTALKWLLVVAFGYAGYKRAKFGRIETHEAITVYSREALLRTKEVAETLGYKVLHMYVDGIWVQKSGVKTARALQPLLDEIERVTGLPIDVEGFYKWIAFQPSKLDARVPVPNRYFGVFENGKLKIRGLELRRHDTPPFVAQLQLEILHLLAKTADLDDCQNEIINLVREKITALREGNVRLDSLLVTHRLSRDVEEYKTMSSAAMAVYQLKQAGKMRFPGQSIRFIYTRGEPRVYAWDLLESLNPNALDVEKYIELTLRASAAVLRPWGIKREWLDEWVLHDWVQGVMFLPNQAHLSNEPPKYSKKLLSLPV